MDKISKIAAAALLASSIAYVSPALAVDTTAEDFVVALSSDFSQGDLATIQSKLNEMKRQGFDGVMFDNDQMVSIDRLLALLADVQAGGVSGDRVAATLLAYLRAADRVRFIMGGIYAATADLGTGEPGVGTSFPAGSAG